MTKRTAEQEERFIELRAAGRSFQACADALGIAKPTALAWGRDMAHLIANAKTERLDELYQQFTIAKTRRLEAFGQKLADLLAEIGKRDLADVPTPTLLTLALKYGDFLKTEETPLEMLGEEKSLVMFETDRETWPI